MSEEEDDADDPFAELGDEDSADDPFAELGDEDSADDPFSELGDEDSADDPFSELGDEDSADDPFAESEEGNTVASTGVDDTNRRDDTDRRDDTSTRSDGPDGPDGPDSPDDPFTELDTPDPSDAGVEDFFEEMEPTDIDEESLWDAVLEGSADTEPEPNAEDGADAVVSTEQYCKKCEHFAEPPATACTNPGTEIVELVGTDRFRLRNCPVVAERQRTRTVFPDET